MAYVAAAKTIGAIARRAAQSYRQAYRRGVGSAAAKAKTRQRKKAGGMAACGGGASASMCGNSVSCRIGICWRIAAAASGGGGWARNSYARAMAAQLWPYLWARRKTSGGWRGGGGAHRILSAANDIIAQYHGGVCGALAYQWHQKSGVNELAVSAATSIGGARRRIIAKSASTGRRIAARSSLPHRQARAITAVSAAGGARRKPQTPRRRHRSKPWHAEWRSMKQTVAACGVRRRLNLLEIS